MIFEFKEYDGVNRTPAAPLILRAGAELYAEGLAAPELVGSWNHLAVVAFAGDVAVGVITYSHEKWRNLIWIHLGYVAPEARRRGLYRLMWDRVVKAAQKLGVPEIHGGTHVDNKAMLACAESLGRKPLFITTRFVVPPATNSSIPKPTPPRGRLIKEGTAR
jgi:GNAT superfamily N-acetyltransferase